MFFCQPGVACILLFLFIDGDAFKLLACYDTQLSVFAFRGGVRLALLTLSRRFSFTKALVDNINNTSLTPSAHELYKNAGFEMKSES